MHCTRMTLRHHFASARCLRPDLHIQMVRFARILGRIRDVVAELSNPCVYRPTVPHPIGMLCSHHGNPPLPLRPTLVTPLPPAKSSLPRRLQPNKPLSPRYTSLPTRTTSRAKISPKPSITPLMNGRTRLMPRTAITRETERDDGSVKSESVREGGAAGGVWCGTGAPAPGVADRCCGCLDDSAAAAGVCETGRAGSCSDDEPERGGDTSSAEDGEAEISDQAWDVAE